MVDEARKTAILKRIAAIPVVNALAFDVQEFREGYCRMIVPHDRKFDGIFGSYHGGLLTTVADSAACLAIMTVTGPDEPLTTTDLTIRFLAACIGDVTAEAHVVKVGRTLCPVRVDLFDPGGRQVATSLVTYMRLQEIPSHHPGG